MSGDPAVAAYEQRLTEAKSAIWAAIQAATGVARAGLPAHHLVNLAAHQLCIEVAAVRTEILHGVPVVTSESRCLLCGVHSPESGVCANCEWRHFIEENR